MSIDDIKKKMSNSIGTRRNLVDFYRIKFGDEGSRKYIQAIKNLADSLAAYSLISYIL